MRLLLTLLLTTLFCSLHAGKMQLDTTKPYRMQCPNLGDGAIVIGAHYGMSAILYYQPQAQSHDEHIYWYFDELEEGSGEYAIRHAVTQQYLTYDGEYLGSTKRYVGLTESIAAGGFSLWTILEEGSNCVIVNVAQPDHSFHVRSSYLVGTYSTTGYPANSNLRLYDSEDQLWGKEQVDTSMERHLEQVTLNGNPMVYDHLNQQYMAIVPEQTMWGVDLQALVEFTPINPTRNYRVVLKGDVVSAPDSILFKHIQPERQYVLQLMRGDTLLVETNLTFTCLPIVEIEGSFTTSYLQGKIRVNELGKTPELLHARLRHRGATASGKAKKAYSVKLCDENLESIDRSFFGLRNDNNWILDAAAVDPSRMRNRLSTDLWNDFSVKPYHYAEESNLVNGTRGQFVEVLLNGAYQGLYCMTEKIDRKQLKLKKLNESTDEIRGALYKSTQWSYEVFMGREHPAGTFPMRAPSNYSNLRDTWASWEMKYPDLGDGEPIDWKPLYDAVNIVAAGTQSTFRTFVPEYFDLPTFLDYFLFIELLGARDNSAKNMYLYNYNITKSNMLSLAPWDLDGTWGRNWDGSALPYDTYQAAIHHLQKRMEDTNFNGYNDTLVHRYAELRNTYFHEDSLVSRIARYTQLFISSGADLRDAARWSGTDSRSLDAREEYNFTADWIRNRLLHLDEKFDREAIAAGIHQEMKAPILAIRTTREGVVVESNREAVLHIYTLQGVLVRRMKILAGYTTIPSLDRGVYLINGTKVVVN